MGTDGEGERGALLPVACTQPEERLIHCGGTTAWKKGEAIELLREQEGETHEYEVYCKWRIDSHVTYIVSFNLTYSRLHMLT